MKIEDINNLKNIENKDSDRKEFVKNLITQKIGIAKILLSLE